MFTVGIIHKNNFKIMEISNIKYEYFLNIVHDYCELIEYNNNDELLKIFVDKCGINENEMNDTHICYENEENIYELCCKTESDESNINGLASYLVYGKQLICGTCMIIKSNITNFVENDKITHNDIALILYKHFMHKALLIKKSIEELYYISDPCELYELYSLKDKYEINIFGLTMIIYHNKYDKYDDDIEFENINKSLNIKFNDKILVILKINEEYVDIDNKLFIKILEIHSNKTNMLKENENYGLTEIKINDDNIKKKLLNAYKLIFSR